MNDWGQLLSATALVMSLISLAAVFSLAQTFAYSNTRVLPHGTPIPPGAFLSSEITGRTLLTLNGPVQTNTSSTAALLFILPGCEPCHELLKELGETLARPGLVFVVAGTVSDARLLSDTFTLDPSRVVVDAGGELTTMAQVKSFPSVVIVREGHLTDVHTGRTARELLATASTLESGDPSLVPVREAHLLSAGST